jgi:2-polyprenyl-3-methyl-5-hydroxy-6-metoxy-1,4-benzoquinol methylase
VDGDAAVAGAVAAYASQPVRVRLHVQLRARTCPFAALVERAPVAGQVLDVGCGHGVLALALALGSPQRSVLGVDIDADKLPAGEAAARRAGATNIELRAVETNWSPGGEWVAIVLADVLYLLGTGAARTLLERLAGRLAPGGVLLVKEIDVRPRWKYQLARIQELVATRITRMTEGAGVDFLPPADIAAVLAEAGLAVEHVPLHRGRLHPHHLVIGRRAA